MDTESETNLIIASRGAHFKLFCKVYWRTLICIITPILLLPIAFTGYGNAGKCWYIFFTVAVFWLTDALHPAVISLIPMSVAALIEITSKNYVAQVFAYVGLVNTLEAMMLIIAAESSGIQQRVALQILLVFGCSHYRLSFMMFFFTAFLSMWLPNVITCGIMIPLVKAILDELEKMGILDVYHSIDIVKMKQIRHETRHLMPTSYTVFYFLGVTYSSSIGGMATLIGSETLAMFKHYCEKTFPSAPKILFPHSMLLNFPGVLMMETLLYLWLNFKFLGLFRAQSEMALEIGMTDEEVQFINKLLATKYANMGKINCHEIIVGSVLILTVVLHISMSALALEDQAVMTRPDRHSLTITTTMICLVFLFIMPLDLRFLDFFRKRRDASIILPTVPSKACLNWPLVRDNMYWSVLFIIGGSCCLFMSVEMSGATHNITSFLLLFTQWPVELQVLVVIIFCKILTEFGPNACVLHAVLPSVVRMSLESRINPHRLMLGAISGCCLPFHLVCGSSTNALVSAYIDLPPWKMMSTGLGPTIIGILVSWLSVSVWSNAVWNEAYHFPDWAENSTLAF